MIRLVHIGYGYWGTNVVRNLIKAPEIDLVAVCDNREERLNACRSLYGNKTEVTSDWRKYLEDPSIDAFSLAIQTEPSFDIACEILKADKHLFIEKPIASTPERAEILDRMAKERQRVLHCDHIMIYHPIIRRIKEMYQAGELGELLYFDVSRMNLGPLRLDVNAMLDLAVHDLAVIDYLTDGKEPGRIEAMGETCFGQQEALTYLTMQYPGFVAHIKSSWISPIKERRTMIGFTEKMIIFDDLSTAEKLKIYDYGFVERHEEYGAYEFKNRTGDIISPNIPQEDALYNSIIHFTECIRTGQPSMSGGEQGLKVVRILDKARRQMEKRS